MNLPLILTAVAFVLAAVALIRSHGESIEGWAVALLALALLWPQVS